ncbi:MAG: hypothetical protein ACRCST_13215 [Turicibacter sp.]
MVECENYVEVMVSGPRDQLDIYADWLKSSAEYLYGTKFASQIDPNTLFLTENSQKDDVWRFFSCNLKRKIRSYKNRNMDNLEFRVNYSVLFGSHTLENGEKLDLNIINFPDGIYEGLVHAFNPLPLTILKRCPLLTADVKWGSYYIKNTYKSFEYEDIALMRL